MVTSFSFSSTNPPLPSKFIGTVTPACKRTIALAQQWFDDEPVRALFTVMAVAMQVASSHVMSAQLLPPSMEGLIRICTDSTAP